jgi:two-component system chemotaxis response regulator CheB
MRVMVVDDSIVFRSQLKNCLDGQEGITVVATAANGKIALSRLEMDACDLIILDLEMPEMNGLQFLAELRKGKFPQRVIVFAAPTKEGAGQVLEALNAGAVDFIAKPATAASLDDALEGIRRDLLPKIIQFKKRYNATNESLRSLRESAKESQNSNATQEPRGPYPPVLLETFKPRVVVIGSSTGGPTALEKLFSSLMGRNVHVPILVAQHMPPNFTEALAKRLGVISGLPAGEGKHGESIVPGHIYVAPGDFHMSVQRVADSGKPVIKIDQAHKRNSVRPAADFLFESAAREYTNSCACFILTGMGEDGKDGAIAIKKSAGAVMIQDRESSVVWGMPGAVHAVGAYDDEGSLEECARILKQMVS